MRSARTILMLAGWVLALTVACLLDGPVARYLHDSGFAANLKSREFLCDALKAPGEYWFAVLVAVAIYFLRMQDWKSAVFLLLATGLSGLNGLVKWVVGRTRPYKLFDASEQAYLAPFQFDMFRGGLAGLFHSKNLCFPSGHACMAFAVAESLAILCPRWRWAFYALASVTAIERFAENAHYLSDCVAAAALAIAGVHLIHWLWFDIFLKQRERNEVSQSVPGANVPAGK